MYFKAEEEAEMRSIRQQVRESGLLQDKEYYTESVLEDLLRVSVVEKDGNAFNEFLHAMTRYGLRETFRKPPVTAAIEE